MIKNLSALYGLHFFKYLMPLILIPYLARTLGLVAWGELAIAQAFASYFVLIVEYGFELSATKQLARCKENSNKRASILADVMGAKIILILFVIIVSIPFQFIISVFLDDKLLYLATLFFAVSSSFNLIWYFQGVEQLVTASLVDIVVKLVGLLSIFVWVKNPEDASLFLVINGFFSLVTTFILFILIHKNTKLLLPSLSRSIFELKNGWQMFVYKVSVSFYTTGNALILSFFVLPEVVAIYTAAEKISKAVIGLLSPITQVLFPKLSSLTKTAFDEARILFKKSLIVMSLIGFIMSTAVYFYSDILVQMILGNNFQEASQILRILALLPVLITTSNVLGIQWMIPNGMEKAFNKIIILSGLINLFLAVVLTPYFKAFGMAWSVVIAELFVTISMSAYLWNFDKNTYKIKNAGILIK